MNRGFFGAPGDSLHIASADDFLDKISKVDKTVPRRTAGRKSHHRERFCIVSYLQQLHAQSLLAFPFDLSKGESPDFVLEFRTGFTVGIEHADFGTERYQTAATILEGMPQRATLEDSYFDLEGNPKDLMMAIKLPGERLDGPGWAGDEPERQWVELLNRRVSAKMSLINREHFNLQCRNELLLYDNSHIASAVSLDCALSILVENRKPIDRESFEHREFDQISLIHGSTVVVDIFQNSTSYP